MVPNITETKRAATCSSLIKPRNSLLLAATSTTSALAAHTPLPHTHLCLGCLLRRAHPGSLCGKTHCCVSVISGQEFYTSVTIIFQSYSISLVWKLQAHCAGRPTAVCLKYQRKRTFLHVSNIMLRYTAVVLVWKLQAHCVGRPIAVCMKYQNKRTACH